MEYDYFDTAKQLLADASSKVFDITRDILVEHSGRPNAIETELNLFGNVPLFEIGGGVSLTVDSHGSFTFALSGMGTLTSDLSVNFGLAAGQLKGYGSSSFDLGHGEAFSWTADVSPVDLAIPKDSLLGALAKGRPVDLFGGLESGYTQDGNSFLNTIRGKGAMPENLYRFDGAYVGGSLGWKGLYELNGGPVYKALGLETATVGRTFEKAGGWQSQPSIAGRAVYNLINIPHYLFSE